MTPPPSSSPTRYRWPRSEGCGTIRSASIPGTGNGGPSSAGPPCWSVRSSGGGSISGEGVVDLTLIAHEFGRHAAPGPLLPANIVAAALDDDPGHGHAELRAGLLAGTSIASWCDGEPHPDDRLGDVRLEVRADGPDVLLDRHQAPGRDGRRGHPPAGHRPHRQGISQVVVPAQAPGLGVRPMHAVDLTRRYYEVTFHDVRVPATAVVGELGGAGGPGGPSTAAGPGHRHGGVGRRHADRLRPDRRVGLRPLLLRPAPRLVPGAQAPVRRHEDVARGQPRHRRRRRPVGGLPIPRGRRTGQRGQGLRRTTTAPSSSRTASRSTAASD